MPLTIQQVDLNDRRQVRDFVTFPFDLYHNCKQWVPPLLSDSYNTLKPTHYGYQDSVADFFLAKDGKTLGRIAVVENKRVNQYLGQQFASFLFFDCIDDQQVSQALFERACSWAKERGLVEINGPRGLTSLDGSGVLVKGFEHRAALAIPYNYAYYDPLIQAAGFEKTSDSLSGYLSGTYKLPERVEAIAEKVKKRRGLWIKSFTSKKEMKAWIPRVGDAVLRSFSVQPGFVPPSEAEVQAQGEVLILLADPRLIKLVMSGEEIVGFVFAYHDIGPGLQKARGRLFPFGWAYILLERRKNDWVNINGMGLVPEHQRVGGDALLFTEIAKSIIAFGFKQAEIVAVNEMNSASRNDMEALGVDWYKAHRSYRKSLV